MIYVDPPVFKKPRGRKNYGHMVADNIEELLAFAEKIGVKKHFWHSKGALSHYDITTDQTRIAITNGAKLIESHELVVAAKLMNVGLIGEVNEIRCEHNR